MEWFAARNGETFGPVAFNELADAARAGQLSKDDLVWCTAMESWLPAAEVSDLWREPQCIPAQSVWQRAPRFNPSNDRKSVHVKGWLLFLCIGLVIIGSALSLAVIF